MKKYRFSVCKGSDCRREGADQVYLRARAEVARLGLVAKCELYRGGCYGLCHLGPNVVIREINGRHIDPLSREDFQLMGWRDETYYAPMTPDRIVRVVQEHIQKEQIVNEFLGDPSKEPPKT